MPLCRHAPLRTGHLRVSAGEQSRAGGRSRAAATAPRHAWAPAREPIRPGLLHRVPHELRPNPPPPPAARAQEGHAGVVSLLLGAGAQLEDRNHDDMTPLAIAAYYGHAEAPAPPRPAPPRPAPPRPAPPRPAPPRPAPRCVAPRDAAAGRSRSAAVGENRPCPAVPTHSAQPRCRTTREPDRCSAGIALRGARPAQTRGAAWPTTGCAAAAREGRGPAPDVAGGLDSAAPRGVRRTRPGAFRPPVRHVLVLMRACVACARAALATWARSSR